MEKIKIINPTQNQLDNLYLINKINEIIDLISKYEPHIIDLIHEETRLKTLEDKVKFIMENSSKLKMYNGEITYGPLQDLWDEQLEEPLVECHHQCSGNCRRVGCNCSCGEYHDEKAEQIKPTVSQEKIEEIISGLHKEFDDYHLDIEEFESWLRDKLNSL